MSALSFAVMVSFCVAKEIEDLAKSMVLAESKRRKSKLLENSFCIKNA